MELRFLEVCRIAWELSFFSCVVEGVGLDFLGVDFLTGAEAAAGVDLVDELLFFFFFLLEDGFLADSEV